MKTTSIFYLFILFACPVFSSPTPNCDVDQACVEFRDDPQVSELKPTAIATIKYIKENAVEINKIPLAFDGGYTTIQGKKVLAWTKFPDLRTKILPTKIHILEDIIKDAKQDYDGWNDPEWRAVTGTLAENASGLIYFIFGEYIPSDDIFRTIELPALKNNKKVRANVTYYLHEDGNISQSSFSVSGSH